MELSQVERDTMMALVQMRGGILLISLSTFGIGGGGKREVWLGTPQGADSSGTGNTTLAAVINSWFIPLNVNCPSPLLHI